MPNAFAILDYVMPALLLCFVAIFGALAFTYYHMQPTTNSSRMYLFVLLTVFVSTVFVSVEITDLTFSGSTTFASFNILLLFISILTVVTFVVLPFVAVVFNPGHSYLYAIRTSVQLISLIVIFVLFIGIPAIFIFSGEEQYGVFSTLDDQTKQNVEAFTHKQEEALELVSECVCLLFFVFLAVGRWLGALYGSAGTVSVVIDLVRGSIFDSRQRFRGQEREALETRIAGVKAEATMYGDFTREKLRLYERRARTLHAPRGRLNRVLTVLSAVGGVAMAFVLVVHWTLFVVSLYGMIAYSDCGFQCGFVPQHTGPLLFVEYVITAVSADYTFGVRYVMVLLFFCNSLVVVAVGTKHIPVKFFGASPFRLRKRQTKPGSILVILMMFGVAVVGFFGTMMCLTPNMALYGAQRNAAGDQCTLANHAPDDAFCTPSLFGMVVMRVFSDFPYLEFVFVLSTLLHYFFLFVFLFNRCFAGLRFLLAKLKNQ